MKILKLFSFLLLISSAHPQAYLSNLNATKDDPVYTMYAAAMERSDYQLDQAYYMQWHLQEACVNFYSEQGGNLGLAFKLGDQVRTKVGEFYREPIVTTSYSDIAKFYYYPFRDIRVEEIFLVYSSGIAVRNVNIINEGNFDKTIEIFPYYMDNKTLSGELKIITENSAVTFDHEYERDGWMLNHEIPLVEKRKSILLVDQAEAEIEIFSSLEKFQKYAAENAEKDTDSQEKIKLISYKLKKKLAKNENYDFNFSRGVFNRNENAYENVEKIAEIFQLNLDQFVSANEKLYENIPVINFSDPDEEALYWNSFSLIRQCMMPPQGESSFNYYVFSREPKWGWGYGGQVFHESLVMLAYAFMDPESAMNSQRVYMERQWENGYINYRTGPYLNEVIEHEGEYTSSAPWYNFQNWEIYLITRDKKFLEEAYKSGKKYYEYYSSNRDKDSDGLAEWGAHAVLECVRDARVAVWDKVGWPSNFEGPDINAMLYSEAVSLSKMAAELGDKTAVEKFKSDAEKRKNLLNKKLWDDETEFFYNIDMKDGDFSFKEKNDLKIKEIIGFLPMWAGAIDQTRADNLMKTMLDEDEFWRPFGVPTLTAKDDYYNPIGYWNGPIWVQWQYLIFRGLLDYGYIDEAKELSKKVNANIINQLKTDHYFWEFYSADDLQAGWNKTYIWTGIAARMIYDIYKLEKK